MNKFQRRQEKLKRLGLCRVCGKKPQPNRTLCEKCGIKKKNLNGEYRRKRFRHLASVGLCIDCKINKRGKTRRCEVCRFAYQVMQSHYRSLKDGVSVHKHDVVFKFLKPEGKRKRRPYRRRAATGYDQLLRDVLADTLAGRLQDVEGKSGSMEPCPLEELQDFEPTKHTPGSLDKVDELVKRYASGQPLWHDEDKEEYEGL